MPGHLVAAGDKRTLQVGVAAAVGDVPLAAGHDLERLVSLFEELDRVGDRLRVTDDLAGLVQDGGHLLLGREDSLACQAFVCGQARLGFDKGRSLTREAP